LFLFLTMNRWSREGRTFRSAPRAGLPETRPADREAGAPRSYRPTSVTNRWLRSRPIDQQRRTSFGLTEKATLTWAVRMRPWRDSGIRRAIEGFSALKQHTNRSATAIVGYCAAKSFIHLAELSTDTTHPAMTRETKAKRWSAIPIDTRPGPSVANAASPV
jgi:hypothetical protein